MSRDLIGLLNEVRENFTRDDDLPNELLPRIDAAIEFATAKERRESKPIDMILHCPACGTQHIDAPDSDVSTHPDGRETAWTNPPHRSHLCASCGHIWRPADVPTNGVQAIATRGKDDSSPKKCRCKSEWVGSTLHATICSDCLMRQA